MVPERLEKTACNIIVIFNEISLLSLTKLFPVVVNEKHTGVVMYSFIGRPTHVRLVS